MDGALRAAGDRAVLAITHDGTLLDGFDRVLTLRAGRAAAWDCGKPAVTSAEIPR
jgi:ABC-type transport system involved in cytochrome bd biosynthesis fused ATPase/permease subunit